MLGLALRALLKLWEISDKVPDYCLNSVMHETKLHEGENVSNSESLLPNTDFP